MILRWFHALRTYLRTPTKRDRERVRIALKPRPHSQFNDATKRPGTRCVP